MVFLGKAAGFLLSCLTSNCFPGWEIDSNFPLSGYSNSTTLNGFPRHVNLPNRSVLDLYRYPNLVGLAIHSLHLEIIDIYLQLQFLAFLKL